MTVLKDGEYKPATDSEMAELFANHPHLARLLTDSDALRALPVESASNILYESWDLVGKRILSQLSRLPQSKMFLVAVDPDG